MDVEFEELLEEAAPHPEAAQIEAELDRQAAKRTLAVPTKDEDVRKRLRELKEPMTLFGERPGDRRDRLKELISRQMAARRAQGQDVDMEVESSDSSSGESDQEQEFFTPGSAALLADRKRTAAYSLKRARARIERQRKEANIPLAALMDKRKSVYNELKTYTNLGTQLADDRPVSSVRFSPNSKLLATGSWSGTVKLWDVPSCNCVGVMKGHGVERIGGLAWHPEATLSQSASTVNLASGGGDGNICLWGLDQVGAETKPGSKPEPLLTPLQKLEGHSLRVCRVAFHPSGRTLGSASYDETWRLWDVETGDELLRQEGHSHEVYAIAFQGDGALVCSGGLDAIGRVWDLRSGKTTMVLDGHVKDILAIDFHPNGYQIATGSNDDTVRIWDMRQLKTVYSIAAHSSTVSDLTFFRCTAPQFPYTLSQKIPVRPQQPRRPINGDPSTNGMLMDDNPDAKPQDAEEEYPEVPLDGLYLATSGYDGKVKFWSSDDWQMVKELSSEQGGKVMSVDLSKDGQFMATGEWTRTFKLFAAQDVKL